MSRKKEDINPASGLRLKSLLAAKGITQKDFAAEFDYTEQHISQIIKGKRRLTAEMARKVADEFDCRYEWLMGYDDFKTLNERMHAISETDYEARQLIMKIIELHKYGIGTERVVCQKMYNDKSFFFPAEMDLEQVFNWLKKDGKFDPDMQFSDFLEVEKNKGSDAEFCYVDRIFIKSPKGSKRYLENRDFNDLLKQIEDFIEQKAAFLFIKTIDKAANIYELG